MRKRPEPVHLEIASAAIRRVVDIATGAGNRVKAVSTDWDVKQVVFMAEPLTSAVRAAILREIGGLEHYSNDRTPHDPADEGFVSKADDVMVSFPQAGETFRWY
ncbi:hypothetical protein [Phreatobacter stygius]|uniref:Uncharacterized protein n=1 Tax=Phreatobacter stygius TaxID=1940610 RepID=A0A4D7BI62_9HYPH|nr:hypothetical protein [Phreatobacter stygius]QCI68756.1 hypothetical protein E8M01_33710 [Phreatobacter stygius]